MKIRQFFLKNALIFFAFTINGFLFAIPNDTIDFFNVGQGHAALINKLGAQAPLLIDAGCKERPFETGSRYDWIPQDCISLASQIGERILDIWKISNRGNLWGRIFFLNVIITHPDEDHNNLIPLILRYLTEKTYLVSSYFTPHFLLGGRHDQYSEFLKNLEFLEECPQPIFSEQCLGIFFENDLDLYDFNFLKTSNCITHLFCPQGPQGNGSAARNRWSIITRIQVEGMTALLTGDADPYVKKQMLSHLRGWEEELETDILLAPHHGAKKTYCDEWDSRVNPRAIIIGASLMHKHPNGSTLLGSLGQRDGRIWGEKVMPHGLQYYGEDPIQPYIIEDCFLERDRLFDEIPNNPIENLPDLPLEHYRLAWIDLPIYTLWTTGSLRFEGQLSAPKFLEAPHGLMGYIAVPAPHYLLNPYIRKKLMPLSLDEETLQEIFFKRMIHRNNQEEILHHNIVSKEALLIEERQDRTLYFDILMQIFYLEKMTTPYGETRCFQWLREAIIERNRKVDPSEERVREAVNFIFVAHNSVDSAACGQLCNPFLEWNMKILKTFLKSVHNTQRLDQYVTLAYNIMRCGPDADKMDDLCPFGFAEWLQLEKLIEFVREEIISPTGESMSVWDVEDITFLRNKGMNFKEIAQYIIESRGFIKWFQNTASLDWKKKNRAFTVTKESFYQKLEEYFPSSGDGFLS